MRDADFAEALPGSKNIKLKVFLKFSFLLTMLSLGSEKGVRSLKQNPTCDPPCRIRV